MANGIELGEFDLDSFLNETEKQNQEYAQKTAIVNRQIVFAIDASNSMQGYKIGAVNECVNNAISKMRSFVRGNGGSIDIYIIGFSSRLFRWTNCFTPVEEFKYSYVEMVDGLTDFAALFNELVALTNNEMTVESDKYVVLFSDGLSTEDYENSLAKWESTKFYEQVNKIVVAFDDDIADSQSSAFFRRFGNTGIIIPIANQEQLLSVLLQ